MLNEKGAVSAQRLFFALWPEPELQGQFANAASAILPAGRGRPVPAANLHVTLVFLGAVGAAQRVCIEDVAARARSKPFELRFDRTGYFRQPQALWFGCTQTPPELTMLVEQLARGAEECGFAAERRPYAAHLTVRRGLRSDPGRPPLIPIPWRVDRFALVESVSNPSGVQYRPLRFWNL